MTTADLRIPADLQLAITADTARGPEWAGYLLCGVSRRGDAETLLGREWVPVPSTMQVRGTGYGFSWHPDFDVQMLNRAQRENLACVVVHYHGGSSPRLSGPDLATASSLMPFVSGEATGRPHAFVVLGDRSASGLVYRDGAEVGCLGMVAVHGSWLDEWVELSTTKFETDDARRHDRLIRGFGEAAFHRLRRARVGVIGCGGGGSHVVQQLAYLGVGSMVLIDRDRVEETNLNRLIGALPTRRRGILDRILRRGNGDVGRLKVEVMQRMVKAIDEDIGVTTVNEFFPSQATLDALRGCDVLVACVDKLQVRDDLNRFAKRYLVPLIDVGVEIAPTESLRDVQAITGRVTKVLSDGPCLRCQGIVDDSKLAAERGGQPPGYTGKAAILDPAVVTLNGIVGSVAATEVLQLLTGFAGAASPNCGWIYDGLSGALERAVKPYKGCGACLRERGAGDP